MTGYERVKNTINWSNTDNVPVMHKLSQDGAIFEHGEALYDIWDEYAQDFCEITHTDRTIIKPDPKNMKDGQYYRKVINEWGVSLVETTFGHMGHVVDYKIKDIDDLKKLIIPEVPKQGSVYYNKEKEFSIYSKSKGCYNRFGWITIFETMHSLRKIDDIFIDLFENNELINTLADRILNYQLKMVEYYLDIGADGIQFADDWGSQMNTFISVDMWRKFFKPRYKKLFNPVLERNKDVFFHCCGYMLPLIDDLADIGVKVIWPQLGTNDNVILANKLHKHKMTIMWDVDRQYLMPYGKPEEIENAVCEARKLFKDKNGGLIWYSELFPGYPLDSIKALYKAFHKFL